MADVVPSTTILYVSSKQCWQLTTRSGNLIQTLQLTDGMDSIENWLQENPSDTDLIILIDSADCWLAPTLPLQSKRSQLELAYALEECIPLDAEDMAIAYQKNRSSRPVVVNRRFLAPLVTGFSQAGFQTKEIAPQVLFGLEAMGKTADSARILVCDGNQRNEFEFDKKQLLSWNLNFGKLSAEDPCLALFDVVYFLTCDDSVSEGENIFSWDLESIHAFAERISKCRATSSFSFQQDFDNDNSRAVTSPATVFCMFVLAALVVLNICLWVGRLRHYKNAQNAMQIRNSIYETVFPKRKRIVEVEKSMEWQLRRQRSFHKVIQELQNKSLIRELPFLLDQIAQHDELRIEKINLRSDVLILEGSWMDKPPVKPVLQSDNRDLSTQWSWDNDAKRFVLTVNFSQLKRSEGKNGGTVQSHDSHASR